MLCPSCGQANLPGADDCAHCRFDLAPLDLPSGQNRIEIRLMEDPVWKLKPRQAVTVKAADPLGLALQRMVDIELGAVLVVDGEGRLAGILTERDFLLKVVGLVDDYARKPVSQFMTADPETIAPDMTVAVALKKMDVGGYRHLPVVVDGKPAGVISVRDVLTYVTRLCREPKIPK